MRSRTAKRTYLLLDYDPIECDSFSPPLSRGTTLEKVLLDREIVRKAKPESYRTWIASVERIGKLVEIRALDEDDIAASMSGGAR